MHHQLHAWLPTLPPLCLLPPVCRWLPRSVACSASCSTETASTLPSTARMFLGTTKASRCGDLPCRRHQAPLLLRCVWPCGDCQCSTSSIALCAFACLVSCLLACLVFVRFPSARIVTALTCSRPSQALVVCGVLPPSSHITLSHLVFFPLQQHAEWCAHTISPRAFRHGGHRRAGSAHPHERRSLVLVLVAVLSGPLVVLRRP